MRHAPSSVHRRRLSSLLTVAPLHQRTLAFAELCRRVTKDDVWDAVLSSQNVSESEWERWSPVVVSPSLDRAIGLVGERDMPPWVALALALHKVRSPGDAHSALYDLALPLASRPAMASYALPLLTLSAHSLGYFSLVTSLRPLTSSVLDLPQRSYGHRSFHLNTFLQAVALFDRSITANDVAVDVLKEMDNRGLTLWQQTEKLLLRDNFRSSQLLDYFRRRSASSVKPEQCELLLRAHASLGEVDSSAAYLHAIRRHCLESGIPPPYPTDDHDKHAQGSAHKANTYYLRSMRGNSRSAFRYFHRLLENDLGKSPSLTHHSKASKSTVDIYDWTTALDAAAHDSSLPARSLLEIFRASIEKTDTYKPTSATYTVVIRGLLRKNALEDAEKLWDEFVDEVAKRRGKENELEIEIDRKALCVGVNILVLCDRSEEALHLLEEGVQRDAEQVAALSLHSSSTPNPSEQTRISPRVSVHAIHALLEAILRIRRPDGIFFIWTHLTCLYFVPPTNLMLRLLLKAAMQAAKMDRTSLKGAVSWYIANNRLFKKPAGPIAPTPPHDITDNTSSGHDREAAKEIGSQTGTDAIESRDVLVGHLFSLFKTSEPSVVGIWANRPSTDAARSVFRGMIFGNWPSLRRESDTYQGGVTRARVKGGDSPFQELARVFLSDPSHFLPPSPPHLGAERPKMAQSDDGEERLGPPLPTVMPTEATFATYTELLGLSGRAHEIPEVFGWMRALDIAPRRETLSVGLVFWMEVGLRGPLFEDGWGSASPLKTGPRTEFTALRTWIRDWVGEENAPTERDIYQAIKRVKVMRDGKRDRANL